MAWTTPKTFVANTVLTAAELNTHLRDNLNETAPAKATGAGNIFVTTGANSIEEREIKSAEINTQQSTTSTTFADLATVGPQVSIETGTKALVLVRARPSAGISGESATAGYVVSGASVVPATDQKSVRTGSTTIVGAGSFNLETGLTPGTNVFKMVYRTTNAASSATFSGREIVVIAL